MAEDIATSVNLWPTQTEVDRRLAPLRIPEASEKHQGDVKLESPEASPLASTWESPVLFPAKKAARDTANAAAVKSQIAQTLVGNPDAQGTTYCSIDAPPPKKPRERKEDAPKPERDPSATGQEHAAEEMEVDSEATDSDEELPNGEILAQRHQDQTPKMGGSEVQKKKKKKKRKETSETSDEELAPLENIQTDGEVTKEEHARRDRNRRQEDEAKARRVACAIHVLTQLRGDLDIPQPSRTATGRAVKYSRKSALDRVNGGLLVVIVPYGVGRPKMEYYCVFVELDLVISTPLQPATQYIQVGKLFMPKGFPDKYQQYDVEEMRDVDLSEIAHLALGEDIPEHLKRRNRAFLAGIGGLNFQKEELRTMTWAEFGVKMNLEPLRTRANSLWVTVPGEVAETYLHEDMVSIKTITGAARIWKDAGEVRRITQQIQEQNEAGIDELRKLYAQLKGSARVQGVRFEDWLQPIAHQTFLPNERTTPEPYDDSPLLSGPGSSGADEKEMPP
jgi:hypothetical protein